ncbi:LOW QUALITY PROTEIN: heat shock protein beta 9-like [Festucalex cinctus]
MLLELSVRAYIYISSQGRPDIRTLQTPACEDQEARRKHRMLCPSVFQPSAALRPLMDPHWPIRSLWPETRPLFYHIEQEMLRHMQEMRNNMEYMERLQQKIFEEMEHSAPAAAAATFGPIAFRQLGPEGGSFALSLDTHDFSPDELSVKQVGRKLRVSGRTEKRQEDGKGSYSYRCQEFRQDLDLPDGVDPETVTCSLAGGRLQIQAPREKTPAGDGRERVVPIEVVPAPAVAAADSEVGKERVVLIDVIAADAAPPSGPSSEVNGPSNAEN